MRINGRRGMMMSMGKDWQLIHYNDGADGLVGGVWADRIRGIEHVNPLDWTTQNVSAANGVMQFSKALMASASLNPGEQLWGRYFIIEMDIAACEAPDDDNLVTHDGYEMARTFIDFGSTQATRDNNWALRMAMGFHEHSIDHNNKLLGNFTNNEIKIHYTPSLFAFPCTLCLSVLPTPDGDVIYWDHHGVRYAASRPFEGRIYGLDCTAIDPWMMNNTPTQGYSQYCDYSVRSLKIYRNINFISR